MNDVEPEDAFYGRRGHPPTRRPASGCSWQAGHYVWQDGRWTWQPGHWVQGTIRPLPAPVTEPAPAPMADPNARWVPGYWRLVGNDWVW